MTEAPGQGQNQTPKPLNPGDVAAMSAELKNPATSDERVMQILRIAQSSQIQQGQTPVVSENGGADSPYWHSLNDARLAQMLTDPNVTSDVKDAISQHVHSRNAPNPSAEQ